VSHNEPLSARIYSSRLACHIAVTVVAPASGKEGWAFGNIDPFPDAEADPLYQASYLKELYFRAEPNYVGR
jgi:glutathionyl-hydroquinone reductase